MPGGVFRPIFAENGLFHFLDPKSARWEGAGSAPLPKSEVKFSKIQAALTAHDSPQRPIGGVSHVVGRQTDHFARGAPRKKMSEMAGSASRAGPTGICQKVGFRVGTTMAFNLSFHANVYL